jgi:GTP-dependent dephospho-CoA kinase
MPRADTRSASSDETAWAVPVALRPRLAERYGPVYAGAEADLHIRELTLFGACGDRVTERALQLGHPPLIGIVDFKTQRHEPVDPDAFRALAAVRHIRVRNPPGFLTEALRRAVRGLVAGGGGLIEVDGEEDLGSLALVESLPAGATVIYGIPGEGASFVRVDAVAKEHVRQLIAQMEPRRLGRGD